MIIAGTITKKGYRRVHVPGSHKCRMEHVVVWEAAHGPVPPGKEIHHVNGDKLDNRIENLRRVTRLEHKRIHSGCELREDGWWKPCRRCAVFKPVDAYYRRHDGISHICKACSIRFAVEYKRRRRAQRNVGGDAGGPS